MSTMKENPKFRKALEDGLVPEGAFLSAIPRAPNPCAPPHVCAEHGVMYGTDTVLDVYRCRVCGREWEQYHR
jgi:hypothetical protein